MNNYKYGIVMYKDTANLGDDIQVYAASRFYKKIDYIIDRENLSFFIPNQTEKVKVVMNGWYNHDKAQFLISPYIDPLFESVHFSENDLILSRGYGYLGNYAKEVLSKYDIGCRDKTTMNVLKKLGYKRVHFSSCLTTTIDPIGEKKEGDYIVAVDMNPKIIKHLRKITNLKIIETTHWLFLNDKLSYSERIKKITKYDRSSPRGKSSMIKNHAKLSFEDRMKLVEKQLKLYQNAKLVITDRIHVGLPCLGLKTKVILIYYDYNRDRVKTFKDFLTNYTEEEFLELKTSDLERVKNPNAYKKYRSRLIKKVHKFMDSGIVKENLPDVKIFSDINIKREEYIKSLFFDKIEDLKKENNKLMRENKILRKEAEEYRKIVNSRSWKILGKYYKGKL